MVLLSQQALGLPIPVVLPMQIVEEEIIGARLMLATGLCVADSIIHEDVIPLRVVTTTCHIKIMETVAPIMQEVSTNVAAL